MAELCIPDAGQSAAQSYEAAELEALPGVLLAFRRSEVLAEEPPPPGLTSLPAAPVRRVAPEKLEQRDVVRQEALRLPEAAAH